MNNNSDMHSRCLISAKTRACRPQTLPKFPDPPKYPVIESPAHTLGAWKSMAARDGALAIYHFGQALAAISPWLHKCPTVSARLDHPAVRLARKAFRAALPSYDAIR